MEYGLSHTKVLEVDKIWGLRRAGSKQFDGTMTISPSAVRDLLWWLDNLGSRDKKIRLSPPDLGLTTDASLLGWGAVCDRGSTGGRWGELESSLHINALELKAILLGLQTFFKDHSHAEIKVLTDNTTAVAFVNHMGGTRSAECNKIAKDIWDWCEAREIWLLAAHVPGSLNVQADGESREFLEDTEWKLNPEIFQEICDRWGTPS